MTPDFKAIVARHDGARPNPIDNPAWANAEMDIAALIALCREAKQLVMRRMAFPDAKDLTDAVRYRLIQLEAAESAFLEATREGP